MTIDRHMGIALGGSLALHLLAAVVAIVWLFWKALAFYGVQTPVAGEPDAVAEEKELTLLLPDMTIVEKTEKPEPAEERLMHENREDTDVEAPSNAPFRSNRNSRAASMREPAGNGDASLPSQEGDRNPFLGLENRETRPSDPAVFGSGGDNEIVIFKSDAASPADEREDIDSVKNAIDGGAFLGDTVAVDAVETPKSRYEREVRRSFQKEFERVAGARKAPPGVIGLTFKVSREGKVISLRMHKDLAPPKLAAIALDAVLDWTPPDVPELVSDEFEDGLVPISFSIYSHR